MRSAPPTLGQHTDKVLAELGLSGADITGSRHARSSDYETGDVKRHAARYHRCTGRRSIGQQADEATRAYGRFSENVAAPVLHQLAGALKAEGYPFTVFTPGDGLRLASDRGRDDFVEFALDTSGDRPQVIGRISQSRGSRRLEEERPVKADVPPDLSEEDVLDFVVIQALERWLDGHIDNPAIFLLHIVRRSMFCAELEERQQRRSSRCWRAFVTATKSASSSRPVRGKLTFARFRRVPHPARLENRG